MFLTSPLLRVDRRIVLPQSKREACEQMAYFLVYRTHIVKHIPVARQLQATLEIVTAAKSEGKRRQTEPPYCREGTKIQSTALGDSSPAISSLHHRIILFESLG